MYSYTLRRGCMHIKYIAQNVTMLVRIFNRYTSETQECSAINDGRSMLVMSLTVLYMAEELETKTLKYDLMQKSSDSSESVAEDFIWM